MSYSTDLGLYIDGSWRTGEGRDTHSVINPATGETVATDAIIRNGSANGLVVET